MEQNRSDSSMFEESCELSFPDEDEQLTHNEIQSTAANIKDEIPDPDIGSPNAFAKGSQSSSTPIKKKPRMTADDKQIAEAETSKVLHLRVVNMNGDTMRVIIRDDTKLEVVLREYRDRMHGMANEDIIEVFYTQIHHGLVLISDGKTSGKPARLELTRDALTVQVPLGVAGAGELEDVADSGPRRVELRRQADGGLGLSVKGGHDPNSSCRLPVLISKIFKNQAADETGALFVGDAIMEVNGYVVDGKSHDEVVKVLREAGDTVVLTVRHYVQMAPFLRGGGGSLRRDQSGSAIERLSEAATWRVPFESSLQRMGAGGSDYDSRSLASSAADGAPEGWRLLAKIPLPMAFLTRYLWGSDKLRHNAFEVRAVDGTSSGIVHCEDAQVLLQWVKFISTNIAQLNSKSIKMSNKFLHPSELIVYLGWVCERLEEGVEGEPGRAWEPRFLILKGPDVCVFQSPPLNSDDLNRCIYSHSIYETAFREAKEGERQDGREWAFWVEVGSPGMRHYVSVESPEALAQVEAAFHRATYYAVTRLQTKTFACNFEGRPSGLVLDLHKGFSLYDIPSKRYNWQFKFSQLKTSSDDGKMRLQLIFHSAKMPDGQEIKDLDCAELYPLVYSMHAFLVTRLISLDPDYLKAPWK